MSGPMFGQCGHFLGYAPRKIAYAIDRYRNETLRLYGVMDRRLARAEFLADDYSIADMATWPWVHVRWLHKIDLDEFPHVRRWYDVIAARPAVQRGIALLADRMKIGNPDKQARAALFGPRQLARDGRPSAARLVSAACGRCLTPIHSCSRRSITADCGSRTASFMHRCPPA